jgi:hypothetical protein
MLGKSQSNQETLMTVFFTRYSENYYFPIFIDVLSKHIILSNLYLLISL